MEVLMMKRLMTILLCLLLAGCSSADPAGTVTQTTAQPEEKTEETVEETTEETPVSFGEMNGGRYENTYAGFGVELDENWIFYSADELQNLSDEVKEMFSSSEKVSEAVEEYPTVVAMKADNENDLCSMNLGYSRMSLTERLAMGSMSEEDLINTMLGDAETMAMVKEAYEAAGITIIDMSIADVTFKGEPHKAMKSDCEVQGAPYYIAQILDYSRGTYGITLTVSSYMEDKTADLLAMFYKID